MTARPSPMTAPGPRPGTPGPDSGTPGPDSGRPRPGPSPHDTQPGTRPLLDRIRGTANTVTLFGAIVFLLGWTLGAGRAPPTLMAMVGLVTFGAFLVSLVAIVVGNRREDEETGP